MRIAWRRRERSSNGGAATPSSPERLEALQSEISELTAANRAGASQEVERDLLRARHRAGIELLDQATAEPAYASPDPERLPEGDPLPEFSRDELTPGLLRAAILRDGCALVRGLVQRERALTLADGIDRAYAERELREAGSADAERELREAGSADGGGYYEEFEPEARFGSVMLRPWIKEGGGLLGADSPRITFEMMEAFDEASLSSLVSGYLGEPALISVHKTTLRKAEPSVSGAWHQDGFFMGPVRALNLWLSLSRCGDEAPGLDILPRRLERYVATGTEGAALTWTISENEVTEAADGTSISRPIFEPGDALLFDELFLHKTGSSPSMPKPRYAIENWFFGGSGFPTEYAPIAV